MILYCPELDELCFLLGWDFDGSIFEDTGDAINLRFACAPEVPDDTKLLSEELTWVYIGVL